MINISLLPNSLSEKQRWPSEIQNADIGTHADAAEDDDADTGTLVDVDAADDDSDANGNADYSSCQQMQINL